MNKRKRKLKLCMGRPLDNEYGDYVIGSPLTSWDGDKFKYSPLDICKDIFEIYSGITLQLGEAVQIKDLEVDKRKEKYIDNISKHEEGT